MQLTDLNWRAIQALPKDTPVVFPLAALLEIFRKPSSRTGQRVETPGLNIAYSM